LKGLALDVKLLKKEESGDYTPTEEYKAKMQQKNEGTEEENTNQ